MKNLFLILIVTLLVSCSSNTEYTYEVIYTDGTTEVVKTRDKIKFTENDCVSSCGCGSEPLKLCGVRKFELLSIRELKETPKKSGNKNNRNYIPINE